MKNILAAYAHSLLCKFCNLLLTRRLHYIYLEVQMKLDNFDIMPSGGSGGENPAMAPSKLAMEFGPLGGRNSNDRIANLCKFKDFIPPNRCGLGIWPPTENQYIKTDRNFFGERLKGP